MSIDNNNNTYDETCKYCLGITAIIRNEADNLEEWLDYHIAAGVDIFYIYDDDSNDNVAEVLAPYIKDGIVEYFPLGNNIVRDYYNLQLMVYNISVIRNRLQVKYMAFIDIDEFILPYIGTDIYTAVDSLFKEYPYAGGIAINWNIFGSSGYAKHQNSVLASYTYRAESDWKFNSTIKSIVNPRCVLGWYSNPHNCCLYQGCYLVNENGIPVTGPSSKNVSTNKIKINHYFCKSKEDWQNKIDRGTIDTKRGVKSKTWQEFDFYDRNEVFDNDIICFINDILDGKKGRLDRKRINDVNGNIVEGQSYDICTIIRLLSQVDVELLKKLFI